jgi:hypothetical protein
MNCERACLRDDYPGAAPEGMLPWSSLSIQSLGKGLVQLAGGAELASTSLAAVVVRPLWLDTMAIHG